MENTLGTETNTGTAHSVQTLPQPPQKSIYHVSAVSLTFVIQVVP